VFDFIYLLVIKSTVKSNICYLTSDNSVTSVLINPGFTFVFSFSSGDNPFIDIRHLSFAGRKQVESKSQTKAELHRARGKDSKKT